MKRPGNVDFVLKDIRSNILDWYVEDLEDRIDKAIEYMEKHKELIAIMGTYYYKIIELLKGE